MRLGQTMAKGWDALLGLTRSGGGFPAQPVVHETFHPRFVKHSNLFHETPTSAISRPG
jgi:hypothetical protein